MRVQYEVKAKVVFPIERLLGQKRIKSRARGRLTLIVKIGEPRPIGTYKMS